MPTFTSQSNGGTFALPARTRAFSGFAWGAGGGSGGFDAGGTGGGGGNGAKVGFLAHNFNPEYGATIVWYIGFQGVGGNGCVTGTGGGAGGGGSIPGGRGGNAGGSGCSGGGGGGGGASAIRIVNTGDWVVLAGGGGGGGGANLNTGQAARGQNAADRGFTTGFNVTGGGAGQNKSGDGAGGGGGGGGSPGGAGGAAGQDNSSGGGGGTAGLNAYNSNFLVTVGLADTQAEPYGYGTPNGNSVTSPVAGAIQITYPELNYYGIAVGTQAASTGNVIGTVGESVELTWVTTTVGFVFINGVAINDGIDGVAYTRTYTGLGAGTTTFFLTGDYNGITGVSDARTVTLYQPPVINSFSATPSQFVTTGNTIALSWQTTNAVSVSLTVNGSALLTNSSSVDGSFNYIPTTAGIYTFVLTATNIAGGSAGNVTSSLSVQAVPPPTIDSFLADPNPALQDTQTTISWSTTNASSASIPGIGSNLPVDGSQTVIPTVIQSGAGGYPGAPTYGNGYRDYVLTATNVAGTSVTQSLRLFVIPQPPVASLTITPTTINLGETVTLSWDNIYTTSASIDQGVGTVTPASSGSTTFTVTGNPNDFLDNSDKIFTISVQGYGGVDTNSYSIQVLIDSTPTAWLFNNKTGALRSTVYYASSNSTTPL